MLGLLYKDFCVAKKTFLFLGAGALVLSVLLFLPWGKMLAGQELAGGIAYAELMAYVHMPMFVYIFLFIMVSGVQTGLFVHDERRVWSNFIAASPIGYKGQVLSKYFITLTLSFAVVVWGFVCDNICMLTSGYYGSASGIYTTIFYIQIILQAIEYPFIIRFGQKHGNTIKVLLFAAFGFCGIVYLLFGKLPENFSIDSVFDYIMRLMMKETVLPTVLLGALAVLPYVSAVLFYLSYKLSCRWYLKGVETYDV